MMWWNKEASENQSNTAKATENQQQDWERQKWEMRKQFDAAVAAYTPGDLEGFTKILELARASRQYSPAHSMVVFKKLSEKEDPNFGDLFFLQYLLELYLLTRNDHSSGEVDVFTLQMDLPELETAEQLYRKRAFQPDFGLIEQAEEFYQRICFECALWNLYAFKYYSKEGDDKGRQQSFEKILEYLRTIRMKESYTWADEYLATFREYGIIK